jgi:uracil-DNA glycosylase
VPVSRPQADRATIRKFERLANEIRGCRLCPLSATRHQAVVYRGSFAPRVVFVGEAPGAEEDRTGLPFAGRSGAILDRAVAELGPTLGPWGVLNLLKCRPPQNRFDAAAARTCRPYLDRQLELLGPEGLVTLGGRALAAVDPAAPRVLLAAGAARARPAGWLFPMIHPAASMRSVRWRERWEQDVGRLRRWLDHRPSTTL